MNSRHSLKQILSPDCDTLRTLLAGIQRGKYLTKTARSVLAPEEAAHVFAVIISEKGAVLWADSAAWATRLRYATPAVEAALRRVAGTSKITPLRVKVLPREIIETKQPARHIRLSRQTADHLTACADYIEHPKLRDALKRLASHRAKTED